MRWSPALIAASVAGLVLVGGVAALTLSGGPHAATDAGSRMRIALFAPPEPTLVEGSTMDVGTVVDGYEHQPIVQETAVWDEPTTTAWLPEDDAPIYDPPVRHWRSDAGPPPEPEPVEVADAEPQGRPLSFGFDRRLPDFVAARQARRAAMEASDDAEAGPDGPARPPERIDPRTTRSPDMFY